jgi:hypothetical protein
VNRAPSISGTPATSATPGTSYSFTPKASDPDGDALAFSISGKPTWATFSLTTVKLTGTPPAGNYANIVISVSDGTATRALPAFSISVQTPVPTGTATVKWSAPTQNTNGSTLTDLAGYRVYHGTSPSTMTEIIEVVGTSYEFTRLDSGTHYFAVAAYNIAGIESEMSAMATRVIP